MQEQLRRNVSRPWYVDSGCSRHMTGDISQLNDIQIIDGGYVSFAGGDKGKITQTGTVSNGVLKFEGVNFVPELKHSLLSVSQICDKDFTAHFTKKECLILKPGIVIPEDWILVRSERQDDAYISLIWIATFLKISHVCFQSCRNTMQCCGIDVLGTRTRRT